MEPKQACDKNLAKSTSFEKQNEKTNCGGKCSWDYAGRDDTMIHWNPNVTTLLGMVFGNKDKMISF